MRKLAAFFMVSLDGYFEGPDHGLSWHNVDAEFNAFAGQQMGEAGGILMGRRTYELMAGFWPTHSLGEDAGNNMVIKQMNGLPKYVFSKSLDSAPWEGRPETVELVKNNVTKFVKKLKGQSGKELLALASSNLCISLLEDGLLDELRIMVNPVVIGSGTTLFEGLEKPLTMKLANTRQFRSGNVLLTYTMMV